LLRTKTDWIQQGWFALEVAAALFIFWLGWLLSETAAEGPVTEALIRFAGFAAGVFLPGLLFGLPEVQIRWNIKGVEAKYTQMQTNLDANEEVVLGFDVFVLHQSLLAYLILRSAIARQYVVSVSPRPEGIVLVKDNGSTVAVSLRNRVSVDVGLCDTAHESNQGRFFGVFTPRVMFSGQNEVQIDVGVFAPNSSKKSIMVRTSTNMQSLVIG
jgi:hypothetical protein